MRADCGTCWYAPVNNTSASVINVEQECDSGHPEDIPTSCTLGISVQGGYHSPNPVYTYTDPVLKVVVYSASRVSQRGSWGT